MSSFAKKNKIKSNLCNSVIMYELLVQKIE